jgi:hypothetical protein
MFHLKPLSSDAIPHALEKAERYRFLNEPSEAESICQDVLAIDPRHQRALVVLLLALTDQFRDGLGWHLSEARDIIARLDRPYDRAYYAGIIAERQGKALLGGNSPGAAAAAHACIREAMGHYEAAESIRPAGNDDSLLRWNACARLLMRDHAEVAVAEERFDPFLE